MKSPPHSRKDLASCESNFRSIRWKRLSWFRDKKPVDQRPIYLLDTKQVLGILPTERFWRQPQFRRPRFVITTAILSISFLLIFEVYLPLLDLWFPGGISSWMTAILALVQTTLLQGAVERYIRIQAKKRRHEIAGQKLSLAMLEEEPEE